jgi:hypothetical protein
MRWFDPATAPRIILVQAGARVLPRFRESPSIIAHRSLEQLGVDVRTNCRVEYVDAAGVRISGKIIAARTVLRAAGVVASPAAQWLPANHHQRHLFTATPATWRPLDAKPQLSISAGSSCGERRHGGCGAWCTSACSLACATAWLPWSIGSGRT